MKKIMSNNLKAVLKAMETGSWLRAYSNSQFECNGLFITLAEMKELKAAGKIRRAGDGFYKIAAADKVVFHDEKMNVTQVDCQDHSCTMCGYTQTLRDREADTPMFKFVWSNSADMNMTSSFVLCPTHLGRWNQGTAAAVKVLDTCGQ